MPLLKNFKPLEANEAEIASFRRKLSELVRRMNADYERELKPLIIKMGEKARASATAEMKEAQANAFRADGIMLFNSFEVGRQLHLLKSQVEEDCRKGLIEGAVFYDDEWHIPETAISDYGILKGKINPDEKLLNEFHERIDNLRRKYDSLIHSYQSMAEKVIASVYEDSNKQFKKQFSHFAGIDILSKLSERGLLQAFNMEVQKNVQLIKSIPQKFFDEIQRMTVESVSGQKRFEGGLVKAFEDLTGITRDRAKLIARDQISKTISSFSSLRFQNIGAKKYIWRSSKDKRVAGRPDGLYPNVDKNSLAHGNHWQRDGKVFSFDNPPPDGNPGQAILCRCYAEPIFEDFE